jgi:arginine deiminase
MRKTTKSISGTSFHDTVVRTTVYTLRKLLGEPYCEDNTGEDKVNFEWVMETDNGDVFTVYDWKEYTVLDEHEIIEFHIGGMNKAITEQAKNEIYEALEDKSKRIK